MVKGEDPATKYYTFSYLIIANGGKKLFYPKRDILLYVSITLAIIAAIARYYNIIKVISISEFFEVSTVGGITLFGLSITSFAIVSSINNEEIMKPLIRSGYYAYAIFSFTWSSLWSLLSGLIGAFTIIFSLQDVLFPIEVFLIAYALFENFISIFFALRHLAIMGSRYNQYLKDAWKTFDEEKEK